MNIKITALPKSFQIDMVYYPIGESFKNILLIVDIQSVKHGHIYYLKEQEKIY